MNKSIKIYYGCFMVTGWIRVGNGTRATVQNTFTCCGFEKTLDSTHSPPSCDIVEVSILYLGFYI